MPLRKLQYRVDMLDRLYTHLRRCSSLCDGKPFTERKVTAVHDCGVMKCNAAPVQPLAPSSAQRRDLGGRPPGPPSSSALWGRSWRGMYLIGYTWSVHGWAGVLRAARGVAGVSQGDLAGRAGTSRPTLSAYERGRKAPTADTLKRLLSAAGSGWVRCRRSCGGRCLWGGAGRAGCRPRWGKTVSTSGQDHLTASAGRRRRDLDLRRRGLIIDGC